MITVELNKITLNIYKHVIDKIAFYIQDDSKKPESGGVLMGYVIDKKTFSIKDVTVPNKLDKSSRFNFVRSKYSVQPIIDKAFEQSKGKVVYLGEWHTHPEDIPTPSKLDCESIRLQMNGNILNSHIIFMLIIGRKGLYVSYVDKKGIKDSEIINF